MNWNELLTVMGLILLKFPVFVQFFLMFPIKILFNDNNLVKLYWWSIIKLAIEIDVIINVQSQHSYF